MNSTDSWRCHWNLKATKLDADVVWHKEIHSDENAVVQKLEHNKCLLKLDSLASKRQVYLSQCLVHFATNAKDLSGGRRPYLDARGSFVKEPLADGTDMRPTVNKTISRLLADGDPHGVVV